MSSPGPRAWPLLGLCSHPHGVGWSPESLDSETHGTLEKWHLKLGDK